MISYLNVTMPTIKDELHSSIQLAANGLTLTELLSLHPMLARRTVQRHVAGLLNEGRITALGEGRARRYFAKTLDHNTAPQATDRFPAFIPVSADSLDILAYIDQPIEARIPVGYQGDFLDAY